MSLRPAGGDSGDGDLAALRFLVGVWHLYRALVFAGRYGWVNNLTHFFSLSLSSSQNPRRDQQLAPYAS